MLALLMIPLQGVVYEKHESDERWHSASRAQNGGDYSQLRAPYWPTYTGLVFVAISYATALLGQLQRLNENFERRWPVRQSPLSREGERDPFATAAGSPPPPPHEVPLHPTTWERTVAASGGDENRPTLWELGRGLAEMWRQVKGECKKLWSLLTRKVE